MQCNLSQRLRDAGVVVVDIGSKLSLPGRAELQRLEAEAPRQKLGKSPPSLYLDDTNVGRFLMWVGTCHNKTLLTMFSL